VAGARFWVGVATISEEVDVDFRNFELFGDVQEVEKVVDVRVLATFSGVT